MSYTGESARDYDEERDTRAKIRERPTPGDALTARQSRLWKAVETIDNVLDGLSVRVAPVLLPEGPSVALSGIDSGTEERSDLGGFLDQLTERLDRLAARAAELTERVDL